MHRWGIRIHRSAIAHHLPMLPCFMIPIAHLALSGPQHGHFPPENHGDFGVAFFSWNRYSQQPIWSQAHRHPPGSGLAVSPPIPAETSTFDVLPQEERWIWCVKIGLTFRNHRRVHRISPSAGISLHNAIAGGTLARTQISLWHFPNRSWWTDVPLTQLTLVRICMSSITGNFRCDEVASQSCQNTSWWFWRVSQTKIVGKTSSTSCGKTHTTSSHDFQRDHHWDNLPSSTENGGSI